MSIGVIPPISSALPRSDGAGLAGVADLHGQVLDARYGRPRQDVAGHNLSDVPVAKPARAYIDPKRGARFLLALIDSMRRRCESSPSA